jgi:hypothetical protein
MVVVYKVITTGYSIKIGRKEVECEGVDCINFAQNSEQWRAVVSAVMRAVVPGAVRGDGVLRHRGQPPASKCHAVKTRSPPPTVAVQWVPCLGGRVLRS